MYFLRVQAVYCKVGVSGGRKLEVGWIKKDFLEKNYLFSDEEVCREELAPSVFSAVEAGLLSSVYQLWSLYCHSK